MLAKDRIVKSVNDKAIVVRATVNYVTGTVVLDYIGTFLTVNRIVESVNENTIVAVSAVDYVMPAAVAMDCVGTLAAVNRTILPTV